MRHRNLKTSVKEHLQSHSLSPEQLRDLMALQDEQPVAFKPRKQYAVAAAFAMVMLMAGLIFYGEQAPQGRLDARIGAEVAQNHINLKPLEVQTDDMLAIQQYFTELDFMPVESRLLADNNTTLLGGRYCSIQGVTAAQLRLQDKSTGQVHSLYQTVYDETIFSGMPKVEENGKPVTVYAKGLGVEMWVEKGVLFAITRQQK